MILPPLPRLASPTLVLSLLACGSLHAALRLPALFSDHMVLQAGQPMPVWGWSDPSADIKVVLTDEKGVEKATGSVVADRDGHWEVTLPALSAGLTAHLCVQTTTGEKKDIADVIVGE